MSTEKIRAGLATTPDASRPAGIEITQRLSPAAGMPVWPPSYEGRLEIHPRSIDGEQVDVIELDSVGSSANRVEECLRVLYDTGEYPLPVSGTTIKTPEGEISITTLDGPHRVFDAWLRNSVLPGSDEKFEDSELGQELSRSHLGALDTVLEISAHDLLFGTWDSHRKGPHGQVRVARALTSTLIGLNPTEQASFAARRDPLNLSEGGDSKSADKKGAGKKLSELGLSSIPPQKNIPYEEDENDRVKGFGASKFGHRGGVSIESALFQGYLSFPALRRLGFQRYDSVDVRYALAWLALYGLALRCAEGWDLRARCVLTAAGPTEFKLINSDGSKESLDIDVEAARKEFELAVAMLKIDDRSVKLVGGPELDAIVAKAMQADG